MLETIFALLGGSKLIGYLVAGVVAIAALAGVRWSIKKSGAKEEANRQLEAQAEERRKADELKAKNAGKSDSKIITELDKWSRG